MPTEEQNQQLQSDKHMLERTLSGVHMELAATQAANTTLSQENAHLENQLRCAKFGAENIRDDDAKTCFYTGLPTFTLFITLFDLLKGYAPESKGINLFFAVLIKLRLKTPMKDLAYCLNCSEPHFSTIFHKWLRIMYHNLRQLIMWPDTETLQTNLPQPFRKHYSRVKCIMDCFEIFIESCCSFAARAATYSNYKKYNTVKVLIAVSPTGSRIHFKCMGRQSVRREEGGRVRMWLLRPY